MDYTRTSCKRISHFYFFIYLFIFFCILFYFFFKFYFIFKLYITVLDLPNIKMKLVCYIGLTAGASFHGVRKLGPDWESSDLKGKLQVWSLGESHSI